ncbi:MAG: hypothetical protein ACLSB9_14425 [Hydrogeniiclostridium mannosilyticum]
MPLLFFSLYCSTVRPSGSVPNLLTSILIKISSRSYELGIELFPKQRGADNTRIIAQSRSANLRLFG